MDDRLRASIEAEFVVERGTWASERVDRVTTALQAATPAAERLETLVVWLHRDAAFTAPGRTIYLSRRLLERLPTDDAAAFVVAHELAHHQLGHVPRAAGPWRSMTVAAVRLLGRWIHGAQHERDADLRAIELCVAAGYAPAACVVALERLAQVALDYGAIDAVVDDDATDHRGRTHPVLERRIADVGAHVAAMASGHRLADELQLRRQARRRQLAIAGGVVGAVALAVIARRLPPSAAALLRRL